MHCITTMSPSPHCKNHASSEGPNQMYVSLHSANHQLNCARGQHKLYSSHCIQWASKPPEQSLHSVGIQTTGAVTVYGEGVLYS